MTNIWTIAKKELRTYFTSPIAYVVITVFLVLVGFFFYSLLTWFNMQAMQMSQNQYYANQININQMVYQPLFNNISIILLLMIPLLTMRLFAEEKKIGTEELLYTSPVSVGQIILGKFLASLLVLLAMLGLTAILSIFTFLYGNPEVAPVLNGYLGLFLMGASFIAIGIFFSSLTENQIVAAVLTFGAALLFWIIDWSADSTGGTLGQVLSHLSIIRHFDSFQRGVIESKDLIFYLNFTIFGLFLTMRAVESHRWRG